MNYDPLYHYYHAEREAVIASLYPLLDEMDAIRIPTRWHPLRRTRALRAHRRLCKRFDLLADRAVHLLGEIERYGKLAEAMELLKPKEPQPEADACR